MYLECTWIALETLILINLLQPRLEYLDIQRFIEERHRKLENKGQPDFAIDPPFTFGVTNHRHVTQSSGNLSFRNCQKRRRFVHNGVRINYVRFRESMKEVMR